MRKVLLLFLSLIFVGQINAQISVESCSLLENDLDARNYPILDDEGAACALVKIVTTSKGFNFEIGQLPVKKVDESKVGEIWVYVPDGTMKMKISHAELGSLRGADVENGYYMFSQRLKRAKVYRMVLTHKEVIKMVGIQDPGNVTFLCGVDGAEVFLGENGKSQGLITGGKLSLTWPKGQSVKYRIHKDRYEDVSGTIKVDETTNVPITLRPLFATVKISSVSGATITINGKEYGTGSVSATLDPGTYSLKSSLRGYHDATKTVTLKREESISLDLMPDLIQGSIAVSSSPSGATIYIDGKDLGTTPKTITHLNVGSHQLELKKSKYVSIRKTINIIGDQITNVNENFTTKYNIQRLKDKANHNQFGIQLSADVISSNSVQLGVEGYFPKIVGLTLEIGGFYGLGKTSECNWYDNKAELVGSATYNPLGAYLNIGFGIRAGVQFRVTPYAGVKYIALISNWNNVGYSSEDPAKNSNAIGAIVGCKFSYLFNEHFQAFAAPNYSFEASKSNGYKVISTDQPIINKALEGFNFKLGVSYIF